MPRKRSPGDGALYYDSSKNLWRGVVDIGFTPDGRRRQKAVTARTQRAAREKLDALKKDLALHGTAVSRGTTVSEWADYWLESVCRPKLKPKPMAAYESVIRMWVVPTIGRKSVVSLKPADIRSVHVAITSAGRSSSTALKAHNIMSAMFEAARRDGVTGRNVVADVDAPRAAVSNRGALSTEDALRILASQCAVGWHALVGGSLGRHATG